ncbi:MAG: response regulator [Vicinamibacteria bacterium]
MNKILIIEDDELISKVYATKYLESGFETAIAADGEQGLALVAAFKPDLIHLDLNLPKLNGAEVIKRIRSNAELTGLPIIVLSNTYQNRLVKGAMSAGATELVSKATCTPRMMIEIVEKHLDRLGAASTPPIGAPIPVSAEPDRPVASDLDSGSPVPDASATPSSPPLAAAIDSPYTTQIHRHAAFQAEVQRGFLCRAPQKLLALRERVAPLFRTGGATRVKDLTELCEIANSFAGQAGIAGFQELSQMSCALVALLRELIDAPSALTPSAVHIIVGASDFLSRLLERATDATAEPAASAIVLVVDDDAIARKAECLALARLNVATVSVDDPQVALRLLSENRFSLVFLDVEMPGMDGFELCRALRALPEHQSTPVVFVSSLADDDTRMRAAASGGNDLIAKPFLPMELAVRALSLLR